MKINHSVDSGWLDSAAHQKLSNLICSLQIRKVVSMELTLLWVLPWMSTFKGLCKPWTKGHLPHCLHQSPSHELALPQSSPHKRWASEQDQAQKASAFSQRNQLMKTLRPWLGLLKTVVDCTAWLTVGVLFSEILFCVFPARNNWNH